MDIENVSENNSNIEIKDMNYCLGCKNLKNEMKEVKKELQNLSMAQAKTLVMLTELLKVKEKKLIFPIKDMNNLYQTERLIEEKKEEYMAILEPLIKTPLHKSLTCIIDVKILLQFNYDGIKGKKSFKELINLNDIIYQCLFKNGYSREKYVEDVRTAFRRIKNKHYKGVCLNKQKM